MTWRMLNHSCTRITVCLPMWVVGEVHLNTLYASYHIVSGGADEQGMGCTRIGSWGVVVLEKCLFYNERFLAQQNVDSNVLVSCVRLRYWRITWNRFLAWIFGRDISRF